MTNTNALTVRILLYAGEIGNRGRLLHYQIRTRPPYCKLLRCGLVKGSFIPGKDIRELRDLTRYSKKLVQAINSEKNRIQKVLEDTKIKLSSLEKPGHIVSLTVSTIDTIGQMIKVAKWIDLLKREGPNLPRPYADTARGKIRELRVSFGSNAYRFLYFFFGKRIIIT